MKGYFGDIDSWRRYLDAILRRKIENGIDDDGVAIASRIAGKSGKELARTVIASAGGGRITLTVPIAGGAHRARHSSPEEWTVAGHGRWTDVHLGALSAAYGQTPYFPHYFPRLKEIVGDAPGMPFPRLCALIEEWAADALRLEEAADAIAQASPCRRILPARRSIELSARLDESLSIADPLFRLGPEAILPLAVTFLNDKQNVN